MTPRDAAFLAIGAACGLAGGLFALMMEYLRMVNKEHREDRKAFRDALKANSDAIEVLMRLCADRDGS